MSVCCLWMISSSLCNVVYSWGLGGKTGEQGSEPWAPWGSLNRLKDMRGGREFMAWPQEIMNIRRRVEEAPRAERGETGGARRKRGSRKKREGITVEGRTLQQPRELKDMDGNFCICPMSAVKKTKADHFSWDWLSEKPYQEFPNVLSVPNSAGPEGMCCPLPPPCCQLTPPLSHLCQQ